MKSKIKIDKQNLKHDIWIKPSEMMQSNHDTFFHIQPIDDYIDDVVWFVADDLTIMVLTAMQAEGIDHNKAMSVIHMLNDYVGNTYI